MPAARGTTDAQCYTLENLYLLLRSRLSLTAVSSEAECRSVNAAGKTRNKTDSNVSVVLFEQRLARVD